MTLRRAEFEGQLADVERRLVDLRQIGRTLEQRRAEAAAVVLGERAEDAKREWLLTLASRQDACADLAACLRATTEAVATLSAARSEEATMRQAYEAACIEATGESPPLGQFEDERDWTVDTADLVEFLHAGPRRPFAEQQGRVAEAEATGARRFQEQVRWAVTAYRGNAAVLDQLGPAVREEALRRIEEERERGRAIRREREERIATQMTEGEVFPGGFPADLIE